jgi:hypothetical protein
LNSICLSDPLAATLPVLGLDVAKKSIQAELRAGGHKVRFGFANNTKGFASWPAYSKSNRCQKFGLAWKLPDRTAMLWRCGSILRAIASVYLIRGASKRTLAAPVIATKLICWMPP